LYLNKKYQPAIDIAQHLLNTPAGDSIPRLNKLVAYSYLGLSDTSKAISYMKQYFAREADSNLIAKDFETMAELYSSAAGNEDSALAYNIKAVEVIKDSVARYAYYKKLAELFKEKKDYGSQAKWLGKFYQNNSKATNIDLFNWGVAHFKAEEYELADTVFGTYIQKYPDQAFGYYWRARSNSLRDSAMQQGFAVPWYKQLVSVIEKDTTNKTNKKWLVEAYGYLAAYETNEMKDYKKAVEWLQKILAIEPENKDALQYISTLQKKISSDKDTGSNR
jgi:tetratricopeptide (TPR) repeat protein